MADNDDTHVNAPAGCGGPGHFVSALPTGCNPQMDKWRGPRPLNPAHGVESDGPSFPTHGEASTYSSYFVNRKTSSGDIYTHEGYTAALLPRSRWYALKLGTLLRLTYQERQVIVKVNDRGAGDGSDQRVLDLSRAAYAYLIGKKTNDITDNNAGLIQLECIEIVPTNTPLGPVKPSPKENSKNLPNKPGR